MRVLVACGLGEFEQDLHHPPHQRLCFPEAVGGLQQEREVVEASGYVGMIFSERFLSQGQRLPMQQLGFGMVGGDALMSWSRGSMVAVVFLKGVPSGLSRNEGVVERGMRGWGGVRPGWSLSLVSSCSFLFSAAIAAAGSYLHTRYPALEGPWLLGNSAVSVLVVALLFALIFRLVPDASITWRDFWLGALIAAVLFELGKFILGFYFGLSAIASSYGAAGSLIIILVWVFYSAQILFFAAEFTRVYALRCGSHQPPVSHPVTP